VQRRNSMHGMTREKPNWLSPRPRASSYRRRGASEPSQGARSHSYPSVRWELYPSREVCSRLYLFFQLLLELTLTLLYLRSPFLPQQKPYQHFRTY
jgi:hypothetical protein